MELIEDRDQLEEEMKMARLQNNYDKEEKIRQEIYEIEAEMLLLENQVI